MTTYLLNWNPKRWDWFDLEEDIADLAEFGWLESRWSCGVNKSIRPGDRFYLVRLGLEPKGIVGSGNILTASFEDLHWDESKAEFGETARFVDVMFDVLLHSEFEQILEIAQLQSDPILRQMNWLPQASGVRIPEHVAEELQKRWSKFLEVSIPLDIIDEEIKPVYSEGSAKEITLTIFERNISARQKCLDHYGRACVVCGFDFFKVYGDIASDYIHVHHVLPLSEIGKEYEVDPIRDLRPVCPNCHAVIHKRKPVYSVEEVREFIRQRRALRERRP